MPITATVEGFNIRFPNSNVSSVDINSVWLVDAKEWVESSLAEKFVVPFGSDNLTASRLTYQKAWHLIRLRTIDPDDSAEMGGELDKEIQALIDGDKAMVTDSGFLYAGKQQTDTGTEIFSTTMNYNPTLDIDDAENQHRDTDHLTALRARRK